MFADLIDLANSTLMLHAWHPHSSKVGWALLTKTVATYIGVECLKQRNRDTVLIRPFVSF